MKHIPKFRVWTGHKMEYNVLVGELGVFYCPGLDENDKSSLSPLSTIYEDLNPARLMQWRGFSDKDGKPIYEGDIVSISEDGYTKNILVGNVFSPSVSDSGKATYVLLRGNVFEEPELLLNILGL